MIPLLLLLALGEEWEPPRAMTLAAPAAPTRVRIDAKEWRADASGWLQISRGSSPGSGTHMKVDSDIDLDPRFVPAVEGKLELGGRHGFGLRYARVYESGERTAEESFVFRGTRFDAGRQVRAEVHFTLLEGDYQFTFNPASPFRISAHLGAHYWRFFGAVKTTDAGTPQDERREFDSAFWLGGLEVSWQMSPQFELRALGVGAFERKHQNFFRVDGEILFKSSDTIVLSAGYRLHSLRFRQSTNRSNYTLDGPTFGLEIAF